jgi:hypothetical protein
MAYHARGEHHPHGPRAYGPPGGPARRSGGVPDGLIVGLLGLAVSVVVLVWSSTGIAGWLRHGEWPAGVTLSRTAVAVRSVLTAPADVPGAWPHADPAALPTASLLWVVFFAQLVVVFSTVLWVMIRLARWRARRRRHTAAPPPEYDAGQEEPSGPHLESSPDAQYDAQYGDARPRSGPVPGPTSTADPQEPLTPVPAVLRAPGGAVVVDPDGSLYEKTARQRSKLGPVHVYDPGHAAEVPVRLRWAPHRGCEDLPTARGRAVALLRPVRPTEPVFQLDAEAADTLLRSFLHAAALSGAPFTHVHRWAQGRSAEAAKVLRGHAKAAPGASMELEAALTAHPGRRDAALALVNRALAGLDQLHIRQSCTPGRVDSLALDNIAGQDGTLYVIGDTEATEPFRRALLAAVTPALHRVN